MHLNALQNIVHKLNVYIYSTPLPQREYDTRSLFKQSKVGLNSVFSFFLIGCLIMAKEPSMPYYLPISGGRKSGGVPSFPKGVSEMQSYPGCWIIFAISHKQLPLWKK